MEYAPRHFIFNFFDFLYYTHFKFCGWHAETAPSPRGGRGSIENKMLRLSQRKCACNDAKRQMAIFFQLDPPGTLKPSFFLTALPQKYRHLTSSAIHMTYNLRLRKTSTSKF
jgi:hypothetical protein